MTSHSAADTVISSCGNQIEFKRADGSHYERPMTPEEKTRWDAIDAARGTDLYAVYHEFSKHVIEPDDLGGYERSLRAEEMETKYPDWISHCRCDDSSFSTSSLWFVRIGSDENFTGHKVVFLPQNAGVPAKFFLYPSHLEGLVQLTQTVLTEQASKALDRSQKPDTFDAITGRWQEKAWYRKFPDLLAVLEAAMTENPSP